MTEKETKKRANLRDVARAAGVSVATVSRVLNTPEAVSKNTRDRVQQAIESLHFVPSAAARAINSGRTRVVGALVPTLDNAIFARFLSALEYELGEFGLSLVVATTAGDPGIEAEKAQRLIDIGAEALIVSGITHSPDFDNLISRTRLPTIATSYYDDGYSLPTIGYDNARASRMALQYLIDVGHRQIAVIHGPADNNDRTRARLSGLLVDVPGLETFKFETKITLEGGATAIQNALSAGTHFTAVMCTSDVLAQGVLFELHRQGMVVPSNVSLVSIDDLPVSGQSVPGITTVHLPVVEMGKKTANAVIRWIEDGIRPDSQLIDVTLKLRQSVAEVT